MEEEYRFIYHLLNDKFLSFQRVDEIQLDTLRSRRSVISVTELIKEKHQLQSNMALFPLQSANAFEEYRNVLHAQRPVKTIMFFKKNGFYSVSPSHCFDEPINYAIGVLYKGCIVYLFRMTCLIVKSYLLDEFDLTFLADPLRNIDAALFQLPPASAILDIISLGIRATYHLSPRVIPLVATYEAKRIIHQTVCHSSCGFPIFI